MNRTALALALIAVPACSWTTYDDLKDDLTVDVSRGPDDPGTTFGVGFAVAGTRLDSPGARFAVLGRNKPTVTRVGFDAIGERTETQANAPDSTFSIQTLSIHPAFAGDPTSSKVALVALTNSFDTQVVIYDLDANLVARNVLIDNVDEPVSAAPRDSESAAFASLRTRGVVPPATDIVFSRRDDIVLIDDPLVEDSAADPLGARMFACTHGGDWSYAIAVADVLSSHVGPEIIVATGSARRDGDPGRIRLLAPETILSPLGAPEPCVFLTPEPLVGTSADYGDEVVVADFDGDGLSEVIASAPSENKVVVIRESAPGILEERTINGNGNDFGDSLAIGDVTGDAKPELLVGAPKSEVDGVSNAGSVAVYLFDAVTSRFAETPAYLLHDSYPENEQAYGSEIAVVPWGPASSGQTVLAVSAKDEVFTYFKTATDRTDVRAGL